MECARKSVRVQRDEHVKRKAVVGVLRAECVQMKGEAKERKNMQERVRVEDLSGELGLNGGLWKNVVEIEERMCGMTMEKERRAAVECQLRFRKNVLKCKNKNGCLNMSERTVAYPEY